MRIKVKVHSHDTGLPEHEQVQFHTEHPGGLMVLRLPKGSQLPQIGAEYEVDFSTPVPAGEQQAGESQSQTGGEGEGAGSDQGGA
jgi:hypothetical protein